MDILRPHISDHHGIFCVMYSEKRKQNQHSYVKRNFTNKSIKSFIRCLNRNKWDTIYHCDIQNGSPGCDEIPAFLLKLCVNYYVQPLTYIFNKSIENGIFPNELKLARVVPIFKSGDPSSICNYRPISVLSFFSKIFERYMYNHVVQFMD